ncbi:MAG: hypothetical protein RL672_807 [Actinomycetota bacterium]
MAMAQGSFRIVAVQAAPLNIGDDRELFATHVRSLSAKHSGMQMVVFPELHLFHTGLEDDGERNAALNASAVPLNGELIDWFGALAKEQALWLVPGSICERGSDGKLYNTTVVFNPAGELVATYRKMFPWRPYEPYTPGTEFTVFDIEGVGRFGLSICYDAWFPEVTRNLAWLGADIVLNVVKTTTPDRAQEVILARANSIVNQTYTVSVNTAGPVGFGRSIIVDPEGEVLAEAQGTEDSDLVVDFEFARVQAVRTNGTAGTNRMWQQFLPTDRPLPLPIYGGQITPTTWRPASHHD